MFRHAARLILRRTRSYMTTSSSTRLARLWEVDLLKWITTTMIIVRMSRLRLRHYRIVLGRCPRHPALPIPRSVYPRRQRIFIYLDAHFQALLRQFAHFWSSSVFKWVWLSLKTVDKQFTLTTKSVAFDLKYCRKTQCVNLFVSNQCFPFCFICMPDTVSKTLFACNWL